MNAKITIVSLRKPLKGNLNDELQWFGNSLGLFGKRDKDKSCFRVFIELLKGSRMKRPFSSDELAFQLSLSRGTVMHHVNKLMESGLVINNNNRYFLRVDSLEEMIAELKRDLDRTCDSLRKVASEIDEKLGL
jgi:predicted transcriptional regulator